MIGASDKEPFAVGYVEHGRFNPMGLGFPRRPHRWLERKSYRFEKCGQEWTNGGICVF